MKVDIPENLMDEVLSFAIAYDLDISLEVTDYSDMQGGLMASFVLSGGSIKAEQIEAMQSAGYQVSAGIYQTKFVIGTVK